MCNPKKGVSVPATNVWDAWKMLTVEPLLADDPRYVDCSTARGTNVVERLDATLRVHSRAGEYMHQLFTGYRGDGKTTELYRFIGLINNKYRPLYLNSETEFDLIDFRFPDFLLGVAKVVFERMEEEGLALPEELLRKVTDWFASVVQTVDRKISADIQAQAGVSIPTLLRFVTGKLVGSIKAGGEKRTQIRKELDKGLPELISHVGNLLTAAVQASKDSDGRELVIIFDNLDRLSPKLAFDLFHTNGGNLCTLKCHFVYVVPMSVAYCPEGTKLPFRDNPISMKMIPVFSRDSQPIEDNIDHLRIVLERRFVPDRIMVSSDEIMRKLILSSGGNLRDLVRLFRQACTDAISEPDEKINPSIAQRAVNELSEWYLKTISTETYRYLADVYKTKVIENDERTRLMIYYTVVLAYDEDGSEWYDVHPAIVLNRRFQVLL